MKKTNRGEYIKDRSLLSLGGIAKGKKSGKGNEREFVKKIVAWKIAREGR